MRDWFIEFFGGIQWERLRYFVTRRRYALTYKDHQRILWQLAQSNYVILTWRRAHMSSWLCLLGHWWLTRRWVAWSHACMNVETGDRILQNDVQIIEAVGCGVKRTGFYQVFDCDAVIVLRPLVSDGFDWDAAVQYALKAVGRQYDTRFDLANEDCLSCVEVILCALKQDPQFHQRFHGLEAMIRNERQLTPAMFVECGSFEVVLEIRR